MLAAMLLPRTAGAQSGQSAYEYLHIPVSAHSAALGGSNISIGEDDITLMYENPALLSNVSDLTLNFDFTSFIAGTKKLSLGFARQLGNRGTWAVGAQYLSYGSMTETDKTGAEIGNFSASDLALQGSYCYMLSDYWSGGVTARMLYSKYADYSAFALGVDLGINYYNDEAGTSLSLAARNLGRQVKALYEERENLPFCLGLAWSQTLRNAPLRLSLTFDDLTHWKDINFIQHCFIGVDIFPSGNTWVAVGYNFRRSHEMRLESSRQWAGFSIGAGLGTKRLKLGLAYGKYHIAASSLVANISYIF